MSVVENEDQVYEILASQNHKFGGRDFDERIVEHILTGWNKKNMELTDLAMERLRLEVERIKKEFDTKSSATILIKDLVPGTDLHETLSRRLYKKAQQTLI